MKVCLINLPDQNSLDPKLDSPLGLMYISSFLNQNEINCSIMDLSFINESDWSKTIEYLEADLFGLTVYSASLNLATTISKLIRFYHPRTKIVFGGTHPTFCTTDIITQNPEVDFIVYGEGEATMLELCQKFDKPYLYDSIMGLGNRKGNTFFISNTRPNIKDLDSLPFPDRETVPIYEYTRTVDGVKSCSLMASRGCVYRCAFCCSKMFWGKPRFQSAERVLNELIEIKKLGFKAVHFWDDTFTINPNLNKILESLKSLEFIFRCNGNLRTDTKETLQKLYDAGCREYSVGIESGDQNVLNAIHKDTTVERNKQVLMWAKEVGLPVKAYIMIGNPQESWGSIEHTINFVKETEPEYYTLFNFVPLPGCEIYTKPNEFGIKIRNKNWDKYYPIGGQNEGGCVVDTEFMSAEEIAEARKILIKELPQQKGKLQKYYLKVQK